LFLPLSLAQFLKEEENSQLNKSTFSNEAVELNVQNPYLRGFRSWKILLAFAVLR